MEVFDAETGERLVISTTPSTPLARLRRELERRDLPKAQRERLQIQIVEKMKAMDMQQVQRMIREEMQRELDREVELRLELSAIGRARLQKKHERDRAFHKEQIERIRAECQLRLAATMAQYNLLRGPKVLSVHVYRSEHGNLQEEYNAYGDLRVDFSPNASKHNADAWATFNDSLHDMGWSQLWVKTASLSPEEHADKQLARKRREDIMYAAGYAEGLLTHHRIDEHHHNVINTFFPDGNADDRQTLAELREFFRKNLDWMHQQIAHHDANPHLADSEYWETVSSILKQFEGLVAGYHRASKAAPPASSLDLLLMNYDGDLQDLIPVVQRARGEEVDDVDPITQEFYVFLKNLKCSALIRILPDFSDLVWGHSTWDTYASMNRIYKHYDVPLPGNAADGAPLKRKISMSSSPAYLSSVDDWYMTDAGLGILETTHGVFDSSLYDFVTPHTVPCHASHAVASRYDLETGDLFSLNGAIDAKVTSLEKFARLECDAEAGPTHDTNPVFEWTSDMRALAPSMGHPERFDFGFVTMAH
ncbi:hypothetical protein P43SY_000596 [Pythium insidiosum]|uniref:Phospholipase B-like n=1 Tax=Pythium insidiosum TaxID=114742 RepID=A0AAD5M2W2_PYTIN|nr:hypothetical protein P43SY_000596 [Pythium insidiosum]